MSSSNPEEKGKELVELSPTQIIIQLAEKIITELKQDSITTKQIQKALKEIIKLAQTQQVTANITSTISRLESSLSDIT